MQAGSELLPHLNAAISAAFKAGEEILEVYSRPVEVTLKDDRSPLTEADLRAHAAIVKVLTETGYPVLSEEGRTLTVNERQKWDRYWLVDPLDGTKEFIKRNGEFTINIALMERDDQPAGPLGTSSPILGVLYVPVTDVLYFSWAGGGAYKHEQAATFSVTNAYERAAMSHRLPLIQKTTNYTIVASRSHQSPETAAFIAKKEEEHGTVELTAMGSALKICLVAEGKADVYPRYAPTMEWDTAAGHAIANEAGKELIDVTTDGPMRYNKNELVNNWFIVQ
ncbi:MAG: 3'(2'),5'-bisphosphate nucleotidase CysQ [Flavobacteriales bacterium]|nr:3'(2'),5'-bisphosphate nucleotidase CysQ [Flavobacteriales bacterium]MBK6944757.1 3'(2'),5'-bisphosphate nucleotidase CysQ [Flavobacteriales bacterium]MBK7295759.1 3'(2'),5'-bisphosphate nucleotidase CysQ [Flavobacteriales bacterium]MBK9534412.1 3'(2'),5'-bisphosphate nucleotidase CysQ [Flavobacteriales bacterium]MBP9137164.1 3'(2'),5'-bisphosphate nucleotidase CysQ [Flavobacteriales bacterium]